MLDTVILFIPASYYTITDYGKFGTTLEEVKNCRKPFFSWVNNPTANDKQKGIYKPRLTLIKRGLGLSLKIEFSAPKIIYKDNINELEDSDFRLVVSTLHDRLREMSVLIFTDNLGSAPVSAFHPSKNIILTGGYTASFAIKELLKINLDMRLDLPRIVFGNTGESLQIYSNAHSFVVYDKIADLKKPEKRAIDKDSTIQQLSIFNFLKKEAKKMELLRFEARLAKKRKMNEILQECGYPANPLFKDVFNKELCKKIVNLYWNRYFNGGKSFIFDMGNNPQRILDKILLNYKRINAKQAIYLTGLNLLCKDEGGIRGLRSSINSFRPKTKWPRIAENLKKFQKYQFRKSPHGFIKDIQKSLKKFESLKVDNSNLACKEL